MEIFFLRRHKYKVENYQLSTKYSQTGLSSQVSSESRHHWQLHTPVSDILDCENSKMNYFKKMKKKVKGKKAETLRKKIVTAGELFIAGALLTMGGAVDGGGGVRGNCVGVMVVGVMVLEVVMVGGR